MKNNLYLKRDTEYVMKGKYITVNNVHILETCFEMRPFIFVSEHDVHIVGYLLRDFVFHVYTYTFRDTETCLLV